LGFASHWRCGGYERMERYAMLAKPTGRERDTRKVRFGKE
jgi:hypothetical protein